MVRQKRILDPSLAKIANTDKGGKGFYGQPGPTAEAASNPRRFRDRRQPPRGPVRRTSAPRRAPMKPQKQTFVDKVRSEVHQLSTRIEALKECTDPFEFENLVESIRQSLENKKQSLQPSEEADLLIQKINGFKQDKETISSRISTIQSERSRVESELQSHKEHVAQIQLELQSARAALSETQRIFEDLEKVHFDSQNEHKTIEKNLAKNEQEYAHLEEKNKERQEALNLVLDAELSLSEASTGVESIRDKFYSTWEAWTPEQMVCWMCQQGAEFEQYKPNLLKLLPQQAQCGADFAYFDSHVLLGLGIGLIRHRGQMMKSIQTLIGGNQI